MGDLISRSALLKEIEIWGGDIESLREYISNMPTAYNVDKVVEQLKLTSKTALDLAIKRIPAFRFIAHAFQTLIDECFEEAVRIVKAGGNS